MHQVDPPPSNSDYKGIKAITLGSSHIHICHYCRVGGCSDGCFQQLPFGAALKSWPLRYRLY